MLLFLSVLMISILGAAEVDLFIPSLPQMQRHFLLSPFQMQFSLSANFIAYCICSLIFGILSDKYTRKSIMVWSLWVFIAGSILCCLADDYNIFLLGRILQGTGIAAPSSLSYVFMADKYPMKKQVHMIGVINGIVAVVLATAPVIGSHITIWYGWRSNFISLLILSIICLILTYVFLPKKGGDKNIKTSFKAYLPILSSKHFMLITSIILLLVIPYWVFIGISPMLYMNDFGVSIKSFGYHQGALAAVFGISCIFSGKLVKWFGYKNCVMGSTLLCIIHLTLLALVIFYDIKSPLFITLSMLFASAGIVIPFNILYPTMLNTVKNSKGRSAALFNALRLIFVAAGLGIISIYYNSSFVPLAIFIWCNISLALILLYFSRIIHTIDTCSLKETHIK